MNNVDIRPAKHIKVLGVLLDPTLSWEPHISSVVRRTNAILVSLFKIRHHLSPEILKILVQSHVFPHLQYCSSVWGGATNSRLDRLQGIIHFAARLVSAAPGALRAMFRPRSAVSGRRTRATAAGAAVLELPRFRLTAARRLFPYRAAAAWNALPRHVTDAASKRQLLRHFER